MLYLPNVCLQMRLQIRIPSIADIFPKFKATSMHLGYFLNTGASSG